jgi:hypothetical protein
MPTFTPPPTLAQRITRALAGHRTALENGDFTHATAAEELLNALLGRWPHKGLAVTDPELDARLSVT